MAELEFYVKEVPSDQEGEGGGGLTSAAPGLVGTEGDCGGRRARSGDP